MWLSGILSVQTLALIGGLLALLGLAIAIGALWKNRPWLWVASIVGLLALNFFLTAYQGTTNAWGGWLPALLQAAASMVLLASWIVIGTFLFLHQNLWLDFPIKTALANLGDYFRGPTGHARIAKRLAEEHENPSRK